MLGKIIQAVSWVGLVLCLGVFVWFVTSQGVHEPHAADNDPRNPTESYQAP